MAVKLGSIVVDLTANTVSFSEAMTKASQISLSSSKNIQRSLGLVTAAATAMAAGVLASLTAVTLEAQHYALEMSRFAEKTGTSVEMMSKLAFSAREAGVPIDMLKGAMERLARTSGNAQGGQGQAIQAYEALGITVADLRGPLSDSGALLIEISKRLATMTESTRKNRIEQQLLGRTGSELNPMLLQMAYGFGDTSAAATKFGIVIGSEAAEQAKRFNETLNELKSIALGLEVRLLNGISPALVDVAKRIEDVVTSSEGMKTVDGIASTLSGSIRAAGSAFEFLAAHATAVKRTLEAAALLQVVSVFTAMYGSATKAGVGVSTISVSIAKLLANASGLAMLTPILQSITSQVALQTFMIRGLLVEESIWAAATYAATTALGAMRAAVLAVTAAIASNPWGAAVVAVLALGTAIYTTTQRFLDQKDVAGTWGDVWNASILKVIENVIWLQAEWKKLTHQQLDDSEKDALGRGFSTPDRSGNWIKDEASNRRTTEQMLKPAAPGLPTGKVAGLESRPLKDAPVLNTHLGAGPSDPVAKKLLDLKLAAEAAQKALADAGKGPDFKRMDEAAAETKKTIEDLNLELGRHGKQLTDVQKAQIKSFIETKVNAESQAKFRDELINTTKELLDQTAALEAHTRTVGRSASDVRDTAIGQNAAKQNAGKDPEWLRANQDLLKKRDEAFAAQYDASNADQDAARLDDLRMQIALQTSLNGVIGKGKALQDALNLSNEQAQIAADFAKRGDTDQQRLQTALETNKELFDLKRQQALLDKASTFNPAQTYKDQVADLKEMVIAARQAGVAINDMQVAASAKEALDSYRRALDDIALKTGTMAQGVHVFFDQMARDGASAAQQIHDVMSSAFNDLNQNLVNLMTGQKANFADFFRGISQQLATMGLNNIESGLADLLGFGKGDGNQKAGPEATNMWLEKIYGVLAAQGRGNGGGEKDGGLGGLLKDQLGDLMPQSVTNKVDSFTGGVFSGLFGGHFALGGDVKAGMTYDVGEMGREMFTPTQDGKIIPNKDLKGGNHTFNIDASGSKDPAQVEAAVHRAMAQAMPQMLQGSLAAVNEQRRRTPLSGVR